MRYEKVVYEKANNDGYKTPLLSNNFKQSIFQCDSWNPYSEEENDRVEFWEVDDGSLSYAEAYQLAYKKIYCPIEKQLFNDWYIAYKRYCKETNTEQKSESFWLDVMSCGDKFEHELYYAHSVYNLTTKDYRSNTFEYKKDGHIWHLKITHGELTDIYQHNVVINNTQYEWVTYDLNTNELFEYYLSKTINNTRINEKYLFENNEYQYPFYFVNSFDELPCEPKITLWDMPWKNNIVTWSQKPYGFIVEYKKQQITGEINV